VLCADIPNLDLDNKRLRVRRKAATATGCTSNPAQRAC
jgi:hypothetical protein